MGYVYELDGLLGCKDVDLIDGILDDAMVPAGSKARIIVLNKFMGIKQSFYFGSDEVSMADDYALAKEHLVFMNERLDKQDAGRNAQTVS